MDKSPKEVNEWDERDRNWLPVVHEAHLRAAPRIAERESKKRK